MNEKAEANRTQTSRNMNPYSGCWINQKKWSWKQNFSSNLQKWT